MDIIITGASSGIGYELAKRFVSDSGNRVFAVARRQDRLDQLVSESGSQRIIPVSLDISKFEYDHLSAVLESHNSEGIGIVVHNAGCLVHKPFSDHGITDWEEVYKTNVFAPALLTRALLPRLGRSKNPSHVVMLSSMGGISGSVKFPGLAAYSSSKGALGIMAEVMAEELSRINIRINTIALGSVQTEMFERAFPGFHANTDPEDVAAFICRFCLDGWQFFNGKTLQMSTGTP
jgi:3-oxoacyl-[acyl-carrier protein] reductase